MAYSGEVRRLALEEYNSFRIAVELIVDIIVSWKSFCKVAGRLTYKRVKCKGLINRVSVLLELYILYIFCSKKVVHKIFKDML